MSTLLAAKSRTWAEYEIVIVVNANWREKPLSMLLITECSGDDVGIFQLLLFILCNFFVLLISTSVFTILLFRFSWASLIISIIAVLKNLFQNKSQINPYLLTSMPSIINFCCFYVSNIFYISQYFIDYYFYSLFIFSLFFRFHECTSTTKKEREQNDERALQSSISRNLLILNQIIITYFSDASSSIHMSWKEAQQVASKDD